VQCIDDLSGKRILRIVETVVTWPGFEQIAENEQVLGGTRPATEKIKKKCARPPALAAPDADRK
jgi:hypothetical protein